MPHEDPSVRWRDVSVRYPFAERDAVGPIGLTLRPGERLLVLGPSGSGKSTLLHTLTGLVPRSIPAIVSGSIELFGEPVQERSPAGWAGTVSHFFQDADQTLCGMRVEDEIAFALENRAAAVGEIRARVAGAMRLVDLPEEWRDRRTMTLSGGEKQLAALAATLVQDAPIFVADEPTAHLAPAAARRLHRLLMELEPGRSVLIVDHRLDGLIAAVDRVAVLDGQGALRIEGPPGEVFREHRDLLDRLGIWRPAASFLDAELEKVGLAPAKPPLSVEEALFALKELSSRSREKAEAAVRAFVRARLPENGSDRLHGPVVARLAGADCAPFHGPTVLRDIDLEVRSGEILGILGANGAGKSTLAASLAGLLRLKGGRRDGELGGIAFQNPENQFVAGSVRDEVEAALPKAIRSADRAAETDRVLAAWEFTELSRRHPFELSQGQKRRLALATLTAAPDRWPLIVLDEPLAGLDARGAATIAGLVEKLRRDGRAIAIVTHDMDFALRLCPHSVVLGEGRVLARGRTVDLLSDAGLLARAGLAEPAVTAALRWLHGVAVC